MQIRPARTDELTAVGELTLAAYLADGLITADDTYATELRAAEERASDAELVVASDEATPLLGTVTFALAGSPYAEISRPGEAEFRMLAVAPVARGRGVGGRLAEWCVERAVENGCAGVALSTLPQMHSAHRIYERMGFQRDPDRDWSPTDQVNLIAYTLDLGLRAGTGTARDRPRRG